MKRIVMQWMLVLSVFVTAGPVNAGGLAVFDGANVTQTVITAKENVEQTLKQIEQYQTQLQQYENMIKNTLAPSAYVWAKAQYTMNRLVQVSNTLEYYRSQGGMDNFLNKYRNASYYSSSPCFNFGVKCSIEQWQSVREGQTNSTDAQKSANNASLRGLGVHQDEVPLDAAHLQLLQSRAETAEGHLAAIQYANQLAAFQSNQLLQLRTMMIGQYNAENSKEQARIDREAMQQAAHEAATKRLSPVTLPPAKVWNVRDIF